VYYSYQVFNVPSSDLKLCDIDDPAAISYSFAVLGELLMHQGTMLRQLLRDVPKFRTLVFQKLEPGHQRFSILEQYTNARKKRPQLMQERRDILSRQLLLEAYRADHQWNYFCAPIWEWCIGNFAVKGLREEAFVCFSHSTASLTASLMFGSSALEPLLRVLINSDEALSAWLAIGGVLSLINGAVCANLLISLLTLKFVSVSLSFFPFLIIPNCLLVLLIC
jgi:hypothetical protein